MYAYIIQTIYCFNVSVQAPVRDHFCSPVNGKSKIIITTKAINFYNETINRHNCYYTNVYVYETNFPV